MRVEWDAASGPVQEYVLTRYRFFPWWPQETWNLPPHAVSFLDDLVEVTGFLYANLYSLEAIYASGASVPAWRALSPYQSTPSAALTRGEGGSYKIVLGAPPADLSCLRLMFLDEQYSAVSWDIPASAFGEGVATLPAWPAETSLPRESSTLRTHAADGRLGPTGFAAWNMVPAKALGAFRYGWLDGRAHLQENLVFVLRAATRTQPFGSGLASVDVVPPRVPMGRRALSALYEEAGFSLGIERPLSENRLWRNYLFDLAAFGPRPADGRIGFLTGANHHSGLLDSGYFRFLLNPVYQLQAEHLATGQVAPALNGPGARWIYFSGRGNSSWAESFPSLGPGEIGVITDGPNRQLLPGTRNYWGLPVRAVRLAYAVGDTVGILDLLPGIWTPVPTNAGLFYFVDSEPPQLETVDYYFADVTQPDASLTPATEGFSPTNTTGLILGAVGQPMKLAGWARQRLANGTPGTFAYLGQYFDKAFKADASGQPTTNRSGILSEYGEFTPTEPGLHFLTTKPDPDQGGLQGTCLVHVVKLQLDVNHDGVMDLSFGGPDNTSSERPFRFWLNNDHDEPAMADQPERDEPFGPRPDHGYGFIRTQRNLEDLARLWVCGVPSLLPNDGYSLTLYWRSVEGNPRLNLYYANPPDGSPAYLSDTNAAQAQFAQEWFHGQLMTDYARRVGELGPDTPYALPLGPQSGNLLKSRFLFEGAGRGRGELVLRVERDGQPLVSSSQWVELHDLTELYERVAVVNVRQSWPTMVEQPLTSTFRVLHTPAHPPETREVAVFVHGWRMTHWDAQNFAQTMFKRLYWQGFGGRFVALRWPTRSADTDPFFHLDFVTYNRSEHIAFKSGTGAAAYLQDLRRRFPDCTISVCAHSMGNIVMMQALGELAAAGQSPIDNYVLMQAAAPAQCYDTNVASFAVFLDLEGIVPTPDAYRDYATGITNALRPGGRLVNFYNPADYALGMWQVNQALYIFSTNVPVTLKPNSPFGYRSDGTNGVLATNYWNQTLPYSLFFTYNGPTRTVTDPHEMMPFVARPRTRAVGRQPGVGGQIRTAAEMNLQNRFGFSDATWDHSGQWNRQIQDPAVTAFYLELRRTLFPPQ